MIYAIIDIGSNTMRLCVYDCAGTEFKLLLAKKETAGLAGYVENSTLTPAGITRCIDVLVSFQEMLKPLSPDGLYAFATASLRNVRNTDEAVRRINEETGLMVDVISGREEAILDFEGAAQATGLTSGLLVDIGGGSTELTAFANGKIELAASLDFGSLSLYKEHVSDLLPSREERHAIKAAVAHKLSALREWKDRTFPDICGVGGTIRTACQLYNARSNLPTDNLAFPAACIKDLLHPYKNPEKKELELLLKLAPDRVHTLIPGMLALQVLSKNFQAERIEVSLWGVREGYLRSRILDKQEIL